MVRSKALLFFEKKTTFISNLFFCHYRCIDFEKNVEKNCDARFFGDKTVLRNFLSFQKKVEKIGKNAFFRKKAYGLISIFAQSRVIIYHNKMRKKMSKKNRKKKRFSFFETFFLK